MNDTLGPNVKTVTPQQKDEELFVKVNRHTVALKPIDHSI